MPDEESFTNLPAKWMLDKEQQPVLANLLLPQFGIPVGETGVPDMAYLHFGHMNPIMIDVPFGHAPTPEDMASFVGAVVPVAQVAMTFDKLREFSQQIQQVLADYDNNLDASV